MSKRDSYARLTRSTADEEFDSVDFIVFCGNVLGCGFKPRQIDIVRRAFEDGGTACFGRAPSNVALKKAYIAWLAVRDFEKFHGSPIR